MLRSTIRSTLAAFRNQIEEFGDTSISMRVLWKDHNTKLHYLALQETTFTFAPTDDTELVVDVMADDFLKQIMKKLESPADTPEYVFTFITGVKIFFLDKSNTSRLQSGYWATPFRDRIYTQDVSHEQPQVQLDPVTNLYYTSGFCEQKRGSLTWKHGWLLHSAKGIEGSCFFNAVEQCLPVHYNNDLGRKNVLDRANEFLVHVLMQQPIRNGVRVTDIPSLVGFLKCDITLHQFNEDNELQIVLETNENLPHRATLVLFEEHYYRLIGRASEWECPQGKQCSTCHRYYKKPHVCRMQFCNSCGVWRKNLEGHVCNILTANMWSRIQQEKYGKDKIFANIKFYDFDPTLKETIIFDFETHPLHYSDKHVVYAAGWKHYEQTRGEYYWAYGYDGLEKFVDYIENLTTPTTVIGYNSANFDTHFVASELIKRHKLMKLVIHNAGGILSLRYTNSHDVEIKFIDLLRFLATGTSLKTNCQDFQLPIQKGMIK
jgi:hypothetical protein